MDHSQAKTQLLAKILDAFQDKRIYPRDTKKVEVWTVKSKVGVKYYAKVNTLEDEIFASVVVADRASEWEQELWGALRGNCDESGL